MDNDLLALAALVAAWVGFVRGFGLQDKYTHLVAIAIAAIFVLVPDAISDQIVTISIVGLSATGAYQYTKGAKK